MAEEIKVGDVVVLKSGGPRMTVRSVEPKNGHPTTIHCMWYCESKADFHKESFQDPGMLKMDDINLHP